MKKLFFAFTAMILVVGTLNAQDQQKWYLTGTLTGEMIHAQDDVQQWFVGGGFGIHRMLGQDLSLGVNFMYIGEGLAAYSSGDYADSIAAELTLSIFRRITDSFYYVPEVAFGFDYSLSNRYYSGANISRTTWVGGISPLGFEYRVSRNWGLRTNIITAGYFHNNNDVFTVSLKPVVSVCYRF